MERRDTITTGRGGPGVTMAEVDGILVVGAGLSGLAIACALRQHGFERVELVERDVDTAPPGAGLAVHANGMRALDEIGVGGLVRAAAQPLERWVLADEQGDELCGVDLASVWGDLPPTVGIARADLHVALERAASGVPIRRGVSVSALTEDADGVDVTFANGTRRRYGLVIGADGIHSTVRAAAFGSPPATFLGQIAWRSISDVRLDGPPRVQFHLGDGCFFGLCSIGGGRTYGFGNSTAERQHDPVSGRLDRLRKRFAHFGGGVAEHLRALSDDEQIHCSPIECVQAPSWHLRRTVLIGDAAHATSPMLGQGASLAFEDALVLARCLAETASCESALMRWEAERRARVSWVDEQSKAVAAGFAMAPERRNEVLRASGAEMLRARLAPLRDPV